MIIFYAITSIVLAALISIFWMISKESSGNNAVLKTQENPDDEITAAALLERIGLEKNSGSAKIGHKKFLFKNFFTAIKEKRPTAAPSETSATRSTLPLPASGTAALRLDNANNSHDTDDAVALAIKNEDLKKQGQLLREQCLKIEALLAEKTEKLDKVQKELENEQKHRKDFNKVKDILEKEIKETKDGAKEVDSQLQSAKAEHQASRNRILQLEEKIKNFEKKIFEKDDAISQLEKTIVSLEAIHQQQKQQPPPKPAPEPAPAASTINTHQPMRDEEQLPIAKEEPPASSEPSAPEINKEGPTPPLTASPEEKIDENLRPVSSLENSGQRDDPQTGTDTRKEAPDADKKEEPAIPPIRPFQIATDKEAPKKASADDLVHLAPDIFKDVERHLREIHEELSVTQEEQNIEIDNTTDTTKEIDNADTKESDDRGSQEPKSA